MIGIEEGRVGFELFDEIVEFACHDCVRLAVMVSHSCAKSPHRRKLVGGDLPGKNAREWARRWAIGEQGTVRLPIKWADFVARWRRIGIGGGFRLSRTKSAAEGALSGSATSFPA
jgi:hypothetical protein